MNISFFGSSLVSSYWNGAATYYRGLLKALANHGCRIVFYEPDAWERQKHRDIADPPWAKVVVYPATPDGWRGALAAGARTADLLVKASGVGAFDAELEAATPQACRPGALCAYWDVDAPATLEDIASRPDHRLRAALPRYDLVLTYGGGDPVVDGYLSAGARSCTPIYNAVDPQTHHPAPSRADWSLDLGFLGNRLPDREARVEEFFLKPASLLPNRRFLFGGSGWDDKTIPPNVARLGHVGTADHNAFFCSPLATLNVNRDSMARYGFSPPTRVFEAAGAGACLMTDEWVGVEQFLEPGAEILVAANGDAVAAFVEAMTPDLARRVGAAARKRILAHHTYDHRALEVMALLGAATRTSGAPAWA